MGWGWVGLGMQDRDAVGRRGWALVTALTFDAERGRRGGETGQPHTASFRRKGEWAEKLVCLFEGLRLRRSDAALYDVICVLKISFLVYSRRCPFSCLPPPGAFVLSPLASTLLCFDICSGEERDRFVEGRGGGGGRGGGKGGEARTG